MIFKNTSKSKLTLAFISIVITFFVWQQGLRDSLNRPSVSFDISQKSKKLLNYRSNQYLLILKNLLSLMILLIK